MADFEFTRTQFLLGWCLLAVGALEAVIRTLVSELASSGGELIGMVSYTFWPPFIAVVGFGLVLATGWGPVERMDARTALSLVPALVALAIVGHAVALIGGLGLYLLIDTPVKYTLYTLDIPDPFVGNDAMFVPFLGWFACALIVWTLPAIVLTRVVDGWGVAAGIGEALLYPRQMLRLMALAAGMVAVPAIAMVAGFRTAVTPGSTLELLGATGILATALVIPFMWLVVAYSVTTNPPLTVSDDANDSSQVSSLEGDNTAANRPAVSLPQIALAGLLICSLVATAGAIRATEFRPVDTDPEPLPSESDELIATAVSNTERADYDYRTLDVKDGQLLLQHQLDRTNRQSKGRALENTTVAYYSTDTFYRSSHNSAGEEHRMDLPIPGYYVNNVEASGDFDFPFMTVEEWEVTDTTDDTLRLEPSESAAVYKAATGATLEDRYDDPEIHEADGWLVIDTDRKTLSHAEFHVNVSDRTTPGSGPRSGPEYDEQIRHEFDTDIEVERPDQSDSLSPLRVFWRVFLY